MKSQVIAEITAPAHIIEAEMRRTDNAAGSPNFRLITNDATMESLHEMQSVNPGGILVVRDELTGWLAGLERKGREQERTFFLEGWDGNSPFTVDRIGRGNIHVKHNCVSLFGSIQPDRLRGFLAKVLRGDADNDGLIQRFQLIVWPDIRPDFTYSDRRPNERWLKRLGGICQRNMYINPAKPRIVRFSPEAQEFFADWLTKLQKRLILGGLSPTMQSHLSKYRSLMPALALLLSMPIAWVNPVELEYAEQAAGWCAYLEDHANRVYGSVKSRRGTAAQVLARHLQNGWKRSEGTFTLRDVYRNQWAGLSTKQEAVAALKVLEDARWVRRNTARSSNGRPSELYFINPKIWNRDTGSEL
jgi:hypothetical protein